MFMSYAIIISHIKNNRFRLPGDKYLSYSTADLMQIEYILVIFMLSSIFPFA